jgi:DNA-binding NarL/FixJ family response regulator
MVQKASPKVPVICVTTHRDAVIIANLNKFNARRIPYRPIDAETLLEAVNSLLQEEGKG